MCTYLEMLLELKNQQSLMDAYERTNYIIFTKPEIHFNISLSNIDLINFCNDNKIKCAAFITAYNPHSKIMTEAKNQLFQSELKLNLLKEKYNYIEGIGQDSKNEWPGEPSYFVLNIAKEDAIIIGKEFKQNAIVWIGKEMLPELVYCGW